MANDADTEDLVRGYAEAVASRELEQIWPYYHDDIVYEDVAVAQVYRGIDETKRFYAASMSALDVCWKVDTICATRDGFGIAWRMSGRHVKDLPGMPATQRRFSVPGASIAEVSDGQIVHNRDFWNLHDLLGQLGLL